MLAHDRAGSGPAVLLIHGLGGSRAIWEPVIERISSEREVVTVDLPGFGRSPALEPPQRPSPAAMAREVAATCSTLGLRRPHVVGNSLGGWVALELAADGDAASVCAISPAGLWRAPLGPRTGSLRHRAMRLRPVIPAVMRTAAGRSLLRNTVARPQNLGRREATRLVCDWLDAEGYDPANDEMRAHVFERGDEIDVPATIVWGGSDRVVGPPVAARMPPGASYRVAAGWGHVPTWDDPAGVAELVLEVSSDGLRRT